MCVGKLRCKYTPIRTNDAPSNKLWESNDGIEHKGSVPRPSKRNSRLPDIVKSERSASPANFSIEHHSVFREVGSWSWTAFMSSTLHGNHGSRGSRAVRVEMGVVREDDLKALKRS